MINKNTFKKYMHGMINHFFKILPLWENNDETIFVYIDSLKDELLGCNHAFSFVEDSPELISLISILQYLYDNRDLDVKTVKREVFKAIDICTKIEHSVGGSEDGNMG